MSEVGQEGIMRLARYSFLLMKVPGQPGTQRLGWWVSSWWFWQRCCTPTLLDVQSLYDVAFGHMSCFWETSQYCPPIWEKWSIVVIQITENKAIPGQGDTSRKVVGSNLGALAVFCEISVKMYLVLKSKNRPIYCLHSPNHPVLQLK